MRPQVISLPGHKNSAVPQVQKEMLLLSAKPGFRFIFRTNEANHIVRLMLVGKLADSLAISFGVRQNNRQPHSIVHALLEKFARQAGAKIEEFPRQIILGEDKAL